MQSESVQRILKKLDKAGVWIAAICAAPVALATAGIGYGKRLTSHPCVQGELDGSYQYSSDRVVVDGNLITRLVDQTHLAAVDPRPRWILAFRLLNS